LSEPFCAKRFSNLHLQYIQPRSRDDTCYSLLVTVWSGFGLFTRPHCSLYSPFLAHNLHHIGRLPATLHSSHHPETLIAKSKGLPGIHHNQEPRLIKQPSPRRSHGDLHRAVSPVRTAAVELSGARLPTDTISANCPGLTAQNFAEPACT
jgi:hypothetical protein